MIIISSYPLGKEWIVWILLMWGLLDSWLSLDQKPQALISITITKFGIYESQLDHVIKHKGIIEPMSNNLPPAQVKWVSNLRCFALIPLFQLKLASISLNYNH